jgi:flagella basal body P-ring formation protein FlgA
MPTIALLFALLAAPELAPAPRDVVPSEVSAALTRALAIPGARIIPLSWSAPRHCRIRGASVSQPIDGSGRVAVKLVGEGCAAWGWVHLEIWAETAVTTRAVRAGEVLAPALAVVEKEIKPGRAPFIPARGAVAVHAISTGSMVEPSDVSGSTVVAGDPVKIVVVAGALAVETQGRRITCGRGRACAVLPSGKHVEGEMDESGHLIVEVPR